VVEVTAECGGDIDKALNIIGLNEFEKSMVLKYLSEPKF